MKNFALLFIFCFGIVSCTNSQDVKLHQAIILAYKKRTGNDAQSVVVAKLRDSLYSTILSTSNRTDTGYYYWRDNEYHWTSIHHGAGLYITDNLAQGNQNLEQGTGIRDSAGVQSAIATLENNVHNKNVNQTDTIFSGSGDRAIFVYLHQGLALFDIDNYDKDETNLIMAVYLKDLNGNQVAVFAFFVRYAGESTNIPQDGKYLIQTNGADRWKIHVH